MGGMNFRKRSQKNQMSSAVRSDLNQTTLKVRNKNWSFLLKPRFACTTFFPKKGVLVLNVIPDFVLFVRSRDFLSLGF